MSSVFTPDGKFKNSYEYECSFALGDNVGQKNERWVPMMTADNAWIPRTEILASHQKMVAEVDQKGSSCKWSIQTSGPKRDRTTLCKLRS